MNLKEYFEANRYTGTWEFGSRVTGKFNKIPFVGTVYGDNIRNDEEGPMVSVHLDLPIKHMGIFHNYIRVSPETLKEYK
jgi:hypothetical protein